MGCLIDLVEALVQCVGENIVLEGRQGRDPVQVGVHIEKITVATGSQVTNPQVLNT